MRLCERAVAVGPTPVARAAAAGRKPLCATGACSGAWGRRQQCLNSELVREGSCCGPGARGGGKGSRRCAPGALSSGSDCMGQGSGDRGGCSVARGAGSSVSAARGGSRAQWQQRLQQQHKPRTSSVSARACMHGGGKGSHGDVWLDCAVTAPRGRRQWQGVRGGEFVKGGGAAGTAGRCTGKLFAQAQGGTSCPRRDQRRLFRILATTQ